MKKLFCTLFLLTIFLFSNEVFAAKINIDGSIKTYEWNNAQVDTVVALSDESNCEINNAFIYYEYIKQSKDIFLALISVEKKIFDDSSPCGVVLRINEEEDIILTTELKQYDKNLYDVDFAYATGNGNEMYYEIRVGLKENHYNNIDLEFCYIDSKGSRSNFYCYEIFSDDQTQSMNEKTTISSSSQKTSKKTTEKKLYSKSSAKKYTTKFSSKQNSKSDKTYLEKEYNDSEIKTEMETKLVSAKPISEENGAQKYIIIAASAVLLIGAGVVLVIITGGSKK